VADSDPDGPALARRLVAGLDAGWTVTRPADADATPDGTRVATLARDETRVATVYAQPDRARAEVIAAPAVAADAAREAGLRVRPKAVHPPRALVFVEGPADVAPARRVFAALVR
jgi:hypothetical protein